MTNSSNTSSRRTFLSKSAIGGASLLAAPLATPAIAKDLRQWKMVTSWPKNLPGPGVTAERLAQRITNLSNGRIEVKVSPAGELVPALEVLSAVEGGVAEMGHSASLFWQGKLPAAAFFTAAPFGLTPFEHQTWINNAGGQEVWDKLYAQVGVKPFMGGNTGFQMGGWFKKPITSTDDFKGLKIRMPGLGGAVLAEFGATSVSLPPSQILTNLQSGVVDAAEFLGPWSDYAMGFYKAASTYHYPGFHEPNGTGEALISLKIWNDLPDDLKEVVASACATENAFAVGESDWNNALFLKKIRDEGIVEITPYPQDVLKALKPAAEKVLDGFNDKDAISKEVLTSFRNARDTLQPWAKVSSQAFMAARG